jgi:hypothetical protein
MVAPYARIVSTPRNVGTEILIPVTNPVESVFATVRHRTVRTRGSLSPTTARLMVFKLVMAASKTWRRLKGENQLPKVVAGVRFRDGNEVTEPAENPRRLIASSPKFLHSSHVLDQQLIFDVEQHWLG